MKRCDENSKQSARTDGQYKHKDRNQKKGSKAIPEIKYTARQIKNASGALSSWLNMAKERIN